MILAAVLATVSLLLPVQDMKGMTLEACRVRAGEGGTLTLLCAGNDPILLDYRLGSKEAYPKFRVELGPEGKVQRIQIRPRSELDWRPIAFTFISLGALFMGHTVWQDDEEPAVSPSRPGR